MKRLKTLSLFMTCFLLAVTFNVYPTSAASSPTIYINGVKQIYDQPPVIQNGRTLVPLRGIFQKLGATVNWHQNTQTITAEKEGVFG